MYRKKTSKQNLEDILARLKNPDFVPVHEPIVYASADISKAKTVLDRLLLGASRSEISSIEKVALEVSE